MSSHLKAELAATCSTLGRLHKGEYLIEPDCLESVKDLIRYLKRDDDSHEIRKYLGESKVLQNDLVHIIKSCPEENSDLFDVTLRLLINLTTPAVHFFRDEIPTEKIGRNIYLSLVGYEQSYKVAFCDVDFWSKVCGKLTDLFETDWAERSADDGIQIERIFLLLRNVLQIPPDEESEKRPENDITVHDKVLWALRQSQILELLLLISTNRNEGQYFPNLLEIFALILREQNPKLLAQCDAHRSKIEKTKDAEDLVKVREWEKHSRNKYRNARNFSVTFVMKGVKSLSDNDVVCHKFLDKANLLKPNRLSKNQVRGRKNRIPVESERPERRSTFSIRLFIKEFCVEFLTSSFSSVMNVVKNNLVSGKSLANDQSCYFWALKFFLEFAVSSNSDVTLIQDLVSAETFHFVQTSVDDAFEHLVADKKKTADWVTRIHLILKAYRSLLETLLWMDCSKIALARSVSRKIKSQIFFVPEYREMTLHILLRYDPTKFPMSYLRDLIETAHLFIKLLEEYARQTKPVVQKVVRKRSKAKKVKKVEESRGEKWEKIKDDVYDVLCSNGEFPEIPPFDATLEIPIDDQKGRAMKNIQELLHLGKIKDAIGLLRSARQVWPENESFGNKEMSIEDETMALQEICIADLGDIDCGKVSQKTEGPCQEEEDEEEEEDDEDSANQVLIVEKDFDIMDYKKRLVNKKIIEGCGILLKNYQKNSDHTNHCIIKFLYRVGWECCMPAMLYQASLFWTLLKILQEKSRNYAEINTFTVNLLRRFRKHATNHPVVFLDLLFWKDHNVALEIQNGYEPYVEKQSAPRGEKRSGVSEEKTESRGRKQKKVPDREKVQRKSTGRKKSKGKKKHAHTSNSYVDVSEGENNNGDDSDSDDDRRKSESFLHGDESEDPSKSAKEAVEKQFGERRHINNDEGSEEHQGKSNSEVDLSLREGDPSVWERTNFHRTENQNVRLGTEKEPKSEDRAKCSDRNGEASEERVRSKRGSELFGEDLGEGSRPESKRVRYVSSDSDSYQSEDELVPVRTKRGRKLAVIDSDSDEEPVREEDTIKK